MVTKIFPAAYVDGIRDVSHAGALPSAGASRAGPGAKTASRSRTLVVSRGTNGSNPASSTGESNLTFGAHPNSRTCRQIRGQGSKAPAAIAAAYALSVRGER